VALLPVSSQDLRVDQLTEDGNNSSAKILLTAAKNALIILPKRSEVSCTKSEDG